MKDLTEKVQAARDWRVACAVGGHDLAPRKEEVEQTHLKELESWQAQEQYLTFLTQYEDGARLLQEQVW